MGGRGRGTVLPSRGGRGRAVEDFEDLPDEQWVNTFDVNIHAIYRITQEALKHMPAGSTIVNSTSIQAYVFLTSPESSYVIGETLNVNGGRPTP